MRCFFHLVNGQEKILDDTGVEVKDLDSAKAEALKAITELRQELGGSPEDWQGWHLVIVDPEGSILHSFALNRVIH